MVKGKANCNTWIRTGTTEDYPGIKVLKYDQEVSVEDEVVDGEDGQSWYQLTSGGFVLFDNITLENSSIQYRRPADANGGDDKPDEGTDSGGDSGSGDGTGDNNGTTNSNASVSLTPEEIQQVIEDGDSFGDLDTVDFTKYTKDFKVNNKAVKDFLTNCRGIHGMPYQYMDEVDPPVSGSDYGRHFTETVVSRMPLLLLTPGKPMFMKGYTDQQKQDILTYMAQGAKDDINELIDDKKASKNSRYYSFEFNYVEYYQYLNPMLQAAAIYLGIGDELLDGVALKNYKWENYSNASLKTFISSEESIAFYIDSETQISESFSNSTGESMLTSAANEASDLSREVQFLLGGLSGMDVNKFTNNISSVVGDFNSFAQKYLGGSAAGNIINSIIDGGVTTVVAGGKIMFPEIWNDSDHSTDTDISIKLRSPDKDTFSLFLNLFVPMFKLVCLVAPQSLGVNGYKAPFLVRGYYKGFFNCDMGIITSMSIVKGDKGKWTRRGLPTQIDVNFTIKDLYRKITLNKSTNPIEFCKNTCLIDWIANNCAININKPDILRTLDLYKTMIGNNVKNIVTLDGFSGVKQELTNLINRYYR